MTHPEGLLYKHDIGRDKRADDAVNLAAPLQVLQLISVQNSSKNRRSQQMIFKALSDLLAIHWTQSGLALLMRKKANLGLLSNSSGSCFKLVLARTEGQQSRGR